MTVFYDSNRMVWLSREDDDQIELSLPVWDAAAAATPVDGSEVDTETLSLLRNTGRLAFVSFMDPVDVGPVQDAVNIVLVVLPGETSLAAGDIIAAGRPDPYRVVGVASDAEFLEARTALEKRMGLR